MGCATSWWPSSRRGREFRGDRRPRLPRAKREGVAYVRVTLLEEPAEGHEPGELVAAFAADQLRDDLLLAFGHKDVIVLK